MDAGRVDWSKHAWETVAPGAREKVASLAGKRLRQLELTQDFVEADWCERGHWGYLAKGELVLERPDGEQRLTAGDGLVLPPGTAHKARVEGVEAAVLWLVEEGEG